MCGLFSLSTITRALNKQSIGKSEQRRVLWQRTYTTYGGMIPKNHKNLSGFRTRWPNRFETRINFCDFLESCKPESRPDGEMVD